MSSKSEDKLSDTERIKAQVEALREEKTILRENIATLAESIGEVRGITIEQGRKIAYIEAESRKAAALVETLKPEVILKETAINNQKIEVLRQKLQDNEKLFKKFLQELQENRKWLTKFKGMEAITEPLDELKKGLGEARKIQLQAERDSMKSEKIFFELQSKSKDLEILKKRVEDIEINCNEIIKDFNNLKIKLISANS